MRKLLIFFLLIGLTANAQVTLIMRDHDYVYEETDYVNGPTIDLSNPTNFLFLNNKVTSPAADGYLLKAGTDLNGANDNNFDGAIISGNYFDWTGTASAPNVHGLLVGYNINYLIKYNFIAFSPLAIVAEGLDMTYTSGGICYNIIKKGYKNGVTIMGQSNLPFYNNTIVLTRYTTYSPLRVIYNTQTTPDSRTNDTKIYNNIFYSTGTNTNFISVDTSGFNGLECDYNLYWCEGGDHYPRFYNTNTYESYTFEDWQALGYDLHSVVVDPNFIDTISWVPGARLDYGVDMGGSYIDYGLDTSAVWTVGQYPDTAQQNGTWQVGAYVYAAEPEPYVADYYVAPDGDDSDPGTYAEPWLTWTKAFETAQPGDTVYFRGGTYTSEVTDGTGVTYNPSASAGNDGERDNLIYFLNYPGEVPILDCSNSFLTGETVYFSRGLYFANVDFVKVRGLTLINVLQRATPNAGGSYDNIMAWYIKDCNNMTFENCAVHHVGGEGFTISTTDTVTLINCDAYNCADTLHATLPGSYGTGFGIGGGSNSYSLVTLTGCRAWQCSDQGFSCTSGAKVVWNNCWSFNNQMTFENNGGDGHSFKTSANTSALLPADKIAFVDLIFNNCIAAHSGMEGWTTNETALYNGYKVTYNNCFAYDCDRYGFRANDPGGLDGDRTWNNCLSYYNRGAAGINSFNGAVNTFVTNSWTEATVTDDDFLSLDWTQLQRDRQPDGSLPAITFGTLAGSSDLINAGTDIGLDYQGTAPDIAWAEWEEQDPPSGPLVTTSTITDYNAYKAVVGGVITDDGAATITGCGIVWSRTNSTPTLSDNVITNGTRSMSAFSNVLSGLKGSTTYYIRAYAENSVDISYGDAITITTPAYTSIGNYKYNGNIVIYK